MPEPWLQLDGLDTRVTRSLDWRVTTDDQMVAASHLLRRAHPTLSA